MTLIGECRGWELETEPPANFRGHRGLFPAIPSHHPPSGRVPGCNRRRRLYRGFNEVHRAVLALLDLAEDRRCAVDSPPVPVVGSHPAPSCGREWASNGASFGRVASKERTIYGYKPHTPVALGGLILDFVLAPAHVTELEAGHEPLPGHTDLGAYGDKGYISRAAREALEAENGIGCTACRGATSVSRRHRGCAASSTEPGRSSRR